MESFLNFSVARIWSGDILRTDAPTGGILTFVERSWFLGCSKHGIDAPNTLKDLNLAFSESTDFWPVVSHVRQALKTPEARSLVRELAGRLPFGVAHAQNIFVGDAVFRLVMPRDSMKPALQSAGSLHRDTWYGLPTRSINCLLAITDMHHHNGVEFFLEFFQKAVPNQSRDFSFDKWKEGHSEAVFPSAPHESVQDSQVLPAFVRRGEMFFFSSQHLHRTAPNPRSLRASLDFRILVPDISSEKNLWPKNIDNESEETLRDFLV